MDKHLSIQDLAEREGVSLNTVYGWNYTGTGPHYLKIGRYVRYRLSDVEKWERSRLVTAREPA